MRHKLRQQKMDLLGLAAPKRSVHVGVDFDGEPGQVTKQLVQAYQERDAEGGRALADLRAQLAQAHGSGPPVLTVLAGTAEEPTGHT